MCCKNHIKYECIRSITNVHKGIMLTAFLAWHCSEHDISIIKFLMTTQIHEDEDMSMVARLGWQQVVLSPVINRVMTFVTAEKQAAMTDIRVRVATTMHIKKPSINTCKTFQTTPKTTSSVNATALSLRQSLWWFIASSFLHHYILLKRGVFLFFCYRYWYIAYIRNADDGEAP